MRAGTEIANRSRAVEEEREARGKEEDLLQVGYSLIRFVYSFAKDTSKAIGSYPCLQLAINNCYKFTRARLD